MGRARTRGPGGGPLHALLAAGHLGGERRRRATRVAPAHGGRRRGRPPRVVPPERGAVRADARGGPLGRTPGGADAGGERSDVAARGERVGRVARGRGPHDDARGDAVGAGHPPRAAHHRGDRADRGGEHRRHTPLRSAGQAHRLPVRARRLRGGVRVVLLPEVPPVRLSEDRRRLHPLAAREQDRPARRRGGHAHRARPRNPDDRRVRGRRRHARAAPRLGREPRPGPLPGPSRARDPGCYRRVRVP